MPTPIRVRGKRGNKQRIAESMDIKQQEAEMALTKDNSKPKTKSMSLIERMPTEILQSIFLYGSNMSLPRSSPVLYANIMSDYMKKKLVIQAFTSFNYDRKSKLTFDHTVSQRKNAQIAQLQHDLLNESWFSATFLADCQREFMYREVKKVVDYFKLTRNCEETFPDQQSFFKHHFSPGPVVKGPPTYQRVNHPFEGASFRYPAKSSFGVLVTITKTTSDGFFLGMKIEVACDAATSNQYENLTRMNADIRMPLVSEYLQVPDRLLRGPWTKDKLRLLKIFFEGNVIPHHAIANYVATNDLSGLYNTCLASKGVEDAIREYCAPALAILVQPPHTSWFEEYFPDMTTDDPRIAPLALSDEHTKFAYEHDTRLFSKEYYCYLGVPVTERHLVAALEAAEEKNDPEAKIFRWLLPLAVLQHYGEDRSSNPKVEDLYVLVGWAHNKKIEEKRAGITEGYGSMALRMLDEEQYETQRLLRRNLKHEDDCCGCCA